MTVEHALLWGKKTVRAVVINGRCWFATSDVFAALGKPVQDWLLERFEPGHEAEYRFTDLGEPSRTLTMVGAQTVAMTKPVSYQGKILYNWLAKYDRLMRASGSGDPPHVPLTMLADGSLPPRPESDPHWGEWLKLQSALIDKRSFSVQVARALERMEERKTLEAPSAT